MNRYARMNALLDAMAAEGHVDVDSLARQFGVSPTTIRRDLNHLHEQQLVTRTRGGAVATTVNYDLPIRYRRASHAPEKTRIGRAAAALVGTGDVVGINGGTTTTEVARAIAEGRPDDDAARHDSARHDTKPPEQITIVTNAINIAGELTVRRHVKLIMTGGVARLQSFELTGPLAYDTLAQIDLDYAMLGVDAFDPALGAKALDEDEARINRLMAERARTVVVVADSSKLAARAFARICPPGAVDYLITDTGAPLVAVEEIRDAGVRVIVV
ncbi:DeoR/GlpR family DNA-binding transcription regulator [Streptomyces sp. NPDC093109]|uniref:DeoR/GlpR family DNA-binding transcription regulator n=1 Tax=Streptomyces sp. NPDC093109 TaxID=3154977 RepID=UPI00344D1A39